MDLWEWGFAWEILPDLLDGLVITLKATGAGIALALVLGLVLAMLRRSRNRLISWPTGGLIEFIRSTPLLVQLVYMFYVLPHFGITLDAFTTGALTLGLHYGTYTSEVYRAGIEHVQVGQWEASTALGLGPQLTWTRIVLPQAIPTVMPGLGNYLIAMFKEIPLLSSITIVEVLRVGQNICASEFRCVEPYTLVGVIFLVISIPSSILVRALEGRLRRGDT
jgi:polar amino acid transport system permease protein